MNNELEQLMSMIKQPEQEIPLPPEPPMPSKVEDLPPPPGISKKYIAAVKAPVTDDKLYYYEELAAKVQNKPDDLFVPTFVSRIDELLDGGFRAGELAIISGPTKAGKTLFCQTISYLQAKNNFPSVWFTLEMSWQELTRKFMAMDEAYKKTNTPTPLPLLYPIDNTNLSLEWLETQIKKAQQENLAFIAYIDHLHFLLPLEDNRSNVSFIIGGIVRELKKISLRLNIPIVLVAHTKKLDISERPDISSIRDSSFVAQESDYAFIVWRERLPEEKPKAEKKEKIRDSYINRKRTAAEKKEKKLQDKMDKVVMPPDEEEIENYTDRTFVSLETNRRNGKTKRFSLFFYDGRFYEREEYEAIMAPEPPQKPEIKPGEKKQRKMI